MGTRRPFLSGKALQPTEINTQRFKSQYHDSGNDVPFGQEGVHVCALAGWLEHSEKAVEQGLVVTNGLWQNYTDVFIIASVPGQEGGLSERS